MSKQLLTTLKSIWLVEYFAKGTKQWVLLGTMFATRSEARDYKKSYIKLGYCDKVRVSRYFRGERYRD